MLTHTFDSPQKLARVVLLGGSGFVGQAIEAALEKTNTPVKSFSSAELDLSAETAVDQLAGELHKNDRLVILSALTPDKGRDIATFMKNLKMIETVCAAVGKAPVQQIVYFSSDAVYPLGDSPVSEASAAAPADLYGAMHLARELMLKDTAGDKLVVLRPTLIYGADDSHNSYGPNRFRRLAAKEGKITIGGKGEETRDHVFVEDVAEIVTLVLGHGSTGVLNVATGSSVDFGALAHMVASLFGDGVEICPTERNMPVTHRHFDITATRKAFPEFQFASLEEGLRKAHKEFSDS
ncbi:MAG: NAD(P)-dependent oxidoreductase [Kordiimonadaceae bacterium]|nr:NAD(P)-dependent oxidoreductase [Kordiimonadaceae bacterium]MBO6568425.1 NAD(P)-dependent oxidoreductase [Kordiimonadaceae bacterium]MBO6963846.1 NAD(P)-dependent oxidoreductase [Kordiimonadaceae bacterium]